MIIPLTNYLGEPISVLLESNQFIHWKFERSVDDDLPNVEINYTSIDNGLSIVCDSDERINSIFIDADNFDRPFLGFSSSSKRSEVLNLLGKPAKSGAAHRDVILGEYGPWDRFDGTRHSIHIEYGPHADKIRRVTLMRADVVP